MGPETAKPPPDTSFLVAKAELERKLQANAAELREVDRRLQDEIALRKREEERLRLLSRVVEQSDEGIAFADMDCIVRFANEAFARMHGYRPDEVVGKPISVFHLPDQLSDVADSLQRGFQEGTFAGEVWHARRNGEPFLTFMRNTVLRDEQGNAIGMIGTAQDITEQKRAQQALRESKTRFQSLVEITSDWIWEVDGEGVYTYASPKVRDLLGYEPDEVVGRTPLDFMPAEEVARLTPLVRRMLRQPRPFFALENLNLHKDGHLVILETSGVPILDAAGRLLGFRGIDRDITERKRGEDVLRESRQMLRSVLDTILVRVFWKDSNSVLLGCNALFATDAGCQSPEEMVGKTDFDFGWREQAEAYRADDRTVMETGVPKLNYQEMQTAPDGSRRWLRTSKIPLRDLQGNVIGVLGTYEDITELKQAAWELERSQERYRTFIRLSSEGIFRYELDPPMPISLSEDQQIERLFETTRLAECNDALARMYGWKSASDILGKSLGTWLIRSNPDNVEHLKSLIRCGYRLNKMETLERCCDGSTRYFLNSVSGEIEDRRLVRIWGVQRDITERKRIEAELTAAKEAAESANKAKDLFLAVLSHELRTPLTPVLINAGVLEADERLPRDVREEMGLIRRNLELEARLIDDLLDLNRIARGKLVLRAEPVDACAKLESAVAICRSESEEKGLSIKCDFAASECYVNGDASRLQQVFWNVLRNAIKFTPAGGSIEARSSNPKPGHLRIEIADTGVGIDPPLLPRLFGAFEQGGPVVTRKYGGLGLGLAISKAFVEMHGGRIWARSDGLGKGAVFFIELPTVPAPAPKPPAAPAPAARPLKLLLVEDHATTLEVLRRALVGVGHEVRTAQDMQAALQMALAWDFDVLISDLGLPDGTGHELMRRIRETRPDAVGVALSGYGMEEDIQRSREAGFAEHLTKPVELSILRASVQRLAPAAHA